MTHFPKPLSLLAIAAVSLLAACSKTPPRPDPSATVLNYPDTGLNQQPLNTLAPGTDLKVRDDGIYEDADKITGLLKPVFYGYGYTQHSHRTTRPPRRVGWTPQPRP